MRTKSDDDEIVLKVASKFDTLSGASNEIWSQNMHYSCLKSYFQNISYSNPIHYQLCLFVVYFFNDNCKFTHRSQRTMKIFSFFISISNWAFGIGSFESQTKFCKRILVFWYFINKSRIFNERKKITNNDRYRKQILCVFVSISLMSHSCSRYLYCTSPYIDLWVHGFLFCFYVFFFLFFHSYRTVDERSEKHGRFIWTFFHKIHAIQIST